MTKDDKTKADKKETFFTLLCPLVTGTPYDKENNELFLTSLRTLFEEASEIKRTRTKILTNNMDGEEISIHAVQSDNGAPKITVRIDGNAVVSAVFNNKDLSILKAIRVPDAQRANIDRMMAHIGRQNSCQAA